MLCLDVNVLIYAHRAAADGHQEVRSRLERRLDGTEPVGVPDAFIAAYAVEQNATLVTNDRGFRRFDGLNLLLPSEL